jgi:predicted alpha-1,6-mannanase (GH76 family)
MAADLSRKVGKGASIGATEMWILVAWPSISRNNVSFSSSYFWQDYKLKVLVPTFDYSEFQN